MREGRKTAYRLRAQRRAQARPLQRFVRPGSAHVLALQLDLWASWRKRRTSSGELDAAVALTPPGWTFKEVLLRFLPAFPAVTHGRPNLPGL